jgi:hypothetical protein
VAFFIGYIAVLGTFWILAVFMVTLIGGRDDFSCFLWRPEFGGTIEIQLL